MNWFNPLQTLEGLVFDCAQNLPSFDADFSPHVRIADPRFGDYQANGVLAYAKAKKLNPRSLAQSLVDVLNADAAFPKEHIAISLADLASLILNSMRPFYGNGCWIIDSARTLNKPLPRFNRRRKSSLITQARIRLNKPISDTCVQWLSGKNRSPARF